MGSKVRVVPIDKPPGFNDAHALVIGDEEDDEEDADYAAAPTVHEIFGRSVRESTYGRAVASALGMCLEHRNCSLEVYAAERSLIIERVSASCFLVVGQVVTCLAVPNAVNFIAQAGDDDGWSVFAPGGSDDPHNFTKAYKHCLWGMPIANWIALLFCYVNISGDVISELRQIVASLSMRSSLLIVEPKASKMACYHLAGFLVTVRFAVLLFFLYGTVHLLGRSDGVANIVLNSLSLCFIISVDDVLASIFNGKWYRRNYSRFSTATIRRTAEAVEDADPRLRQRMEFMVELLYVLFTSYIVYPLTLVARRTSQGRLSGSGNASLMPEYFTDLMIYMMITVFAVLTVMVGCFAGMNVYRGSRNTMTQRQLMKSVFESNFLQTLFLGAMLYGCLYGAYALLESDIPVLADGGPGGGDSNNGDSNNNNNNDDGGSGGGRR